MIFYVFKDREAGRLLNFPGTPHQGCRVVPSPSVSPKATFGFIINVSPLIMRKDSDSHIVV
jgi:hypothetical protein